MTSHYVAPCHTHPLNPGRLRSVEAEKTVKRKGEVLRNRGSLPWLFTLSGLGFTGDASLRLWHGGDGNSQVAVLSSSSGREPSAPWKLEWKDRLVQEEIVFEVSKSYKFIMNLHSYLVKLLDKKYASFLPQPKAQLNQVQLLCCYMCSP